MHRGLGLFWEDTDWTAYYCQYSEPIKSSLYAETIDRRTVPFFLSLSLSLAITDSDRIHREQYKWTMKERKRGKALYFLLIVWRIAKKREAFVHE